MKQKERKRIILAGVACAVLLAGASWYSVRFNDARLVAPTVLSQYVFRVRDLPMIAALTLVIGYGLFLFFLLLRGIFAAKRREETSRTTRTVDPRLGLLGFCGLFGFLGFWTYAVNKTVAPFLFFAFFGFFGFFYEGKMSGVLMDERYRENRIKAQLAASRAAMGMLFLGTFLLGQGALLGNLEYTLIALMILVALSIALEVFLSEYLLYRYDQEELPEKSGE